jgi:hypothetical protein
MIETEYTPIVPLRRVFYREMSELNLQFAHFCVPVQAASFDSVIDKACDSNIMH